MVVYRLAPRTPQWLRRTQSILRATVVQECVLKVVQFVLLGVYYARYFDRFSGMFSRVWIGVSFFGELGSGLCWAKLITTACAL